MKRIMIILFLFMSFFVLTLYVLQWGIKHTKIIPPKRPNNIPESAIWIGGPDGGNWIECKSDHSDSNTFKCTVYNDVNGDIMFKGTMKLEGERMSEHQLKKNLNFYTDEKIYLFDNRVLKPVLQGKSTLKRK